MTVIFTCPFCHAATIHPRDVREKYCPRCHEFVTDILYILKIEERATRRFEFQDNSVTMRAHTAVYVVNALLRATPGSLALHPERSVETVQVPRNFVLQAIDLIEKSVNA